MKVYLTKDEVYAMPQSRVQQAAKLAGAKENVKPAFAAVDRRGDVLAIPHGRELCIVAFMEDGRVVVEEFDEQRAQREAKVDKKGGSLTVWLPTR